MTGDIAIAGFGMQFRLEATCDKCGHGTFSNTTHANKATGKIDTIIVCVQCGEGKVIE